MRLVPGRLVGRALAILNGGNALATVVAAPAGSYLGAVVGWRGAFFCVVPLAAVALAWQLVSLPRLEATHGGAPAKPSRLLRRPEVRCGMAAVGLFFMGQFALFTYLRPFLERVTRVDVAMLSFMLLLIGVAGLVGTTVIGALLRKGLYRVLAGIPALMAAIALALLGAGSSLPATAILLAGWGLVATAAPVGWWMWLSRTLPQDAEAGGGLMVAVIQLAIMLGAMVGGVLFDAGGYRAAFGAGAVLLFAAAVLALRAGRAGQAAHAA
jgi:predicted MFS family arabinose efflux permease